MPERPDRLSTPKQEYRPVVLKGVRHKQAISVWVVIVLILFSWVGATLAAPISKYAGLAIAPTIYTFFSYICHQMPDRSFHVLGEQFSVCSRCFGVYFGLLIGVVAYPFLRAIDNVEPPPRFWLFLSLIPVSIDWSLTVFGIWENTQVSRFITGGLLGFTCAIFIIPAIFEITRNTAFRLRET